MTSMMGRDDVESRVWEAGVRDPRKVRLIMEAVDLYAIAFAQRTLNAEEALLPPLKPGDYDAARAVICCLECGTVKHFMLFPKVKGAPNGRGNMCKHCTDAPRPAASRFTDPDKIIVCRECGDAKKADGNFYVRRDNLSGYMKACKDCVSGKRVCPGCDRKRMARKFISGSELCASCRGEEDD